MASQGTPTEGKKANPIQQLVSRVKTIFKKKKPTTAAAASTSEEPTKKTTASPDAGTEQEGNAKTQVIYGNQYQLEKAKELFKKYGMDLDVDNWVISPIDPSRRVEKKIRMRVRRICHQCQTTIGAGKTCPECHHQLCKECSRYPPKKKKKKEKEKEKEQQTATEIEKTEPVQEESEKGKTEPAQEESATAAT